MSSMKELKTRINLVRVAMFMQFPTMFCGFIMMLAIVGEPVSNAPANAYLYQILCAGLGGLICAISGFVFLVASRHEFMLVKKYNRRASVRRANGVYIKNMKAIGYSLIKAG